MRRVVVRLPLARNARLEGTGHDLQRRRHALAGVGADGSYRVAAQGDAADATEAKLRQRHGFAVHRQHPELDGQRHARAAAIEDAEGRVAEAAVGREVGRATDVGRPGRRVRHDRSGLHRMLRAELVLEDGDALPFAQDDRLDIRVLAATPDVRVMRLLVRHHRAAVGAGRQLRVCDGAGVRRSVRNATKDVGRSHAVGVVADQYLRGQRGVCRVHANWRYRIAARQRGDAPERKRTRSPDASRRVRQRRRRRHPQRHQLEVPPLVRRLVVENAKQAIFQRTDINSVKLDVKRLRHRAAAPSRPQTANSDASLRSLGRR